MIALLADPRGTPIYAAAKTLAAIGGPRDLIALDAWLASGVYAKGAVIEAPELRGHVAKCCDQLKQRLDAAKKAKK